MASASAPGADTDLSFDVTKVALGAHTMTATVADVLGGETSSNPVRWRRVRATLMFLSLLNNPWIYTEARNRWGENLAGDLLPDPPSDLDGYEVFRGVTLSLFSRPPGTQTWHHVSDYITGCLNSPGQICDNVHLRPRQSLEYVLRFGGNDDLEAASSKVYLEQVAPAVSVHAPTKVTHGSPLLVSGMVSPTERPAAIKLQQRAGNTWSDIAEGTVASNGTYRITFTPAGPGRVVLRVRMPADELRAEGRTNAFVRDVR